MSEEQKRLLEQQLWNIANTLRGKMDADEFRDYILGFIFYKYLSERMNTYADEILEQDGISFQSIDEETADGKRYLEAIRDEAVESLGYFLKPSELFSAVARRGNGNGKHGNTFILEDLARILNNIEQSTMGTDSEDDFDHLFEDLDLGSTKLGRTVEARNELISKVLSHLDKIDFRLEDTEADVLGDAYEYLIAQFASGAGKKAGEFYTPQEVSKVLAKLVTVGKDRLKSVYDPTCGSGSLLLRVKREVKEVGTFYGQELNRTTYNLCRMNMILHGINYQKFDIKQEDSLEHPQHSELRAEAIVANPPFSAKWSANPLHLGDDRFSQYGRLAPSSKADWAFIQHMIHHLGENGTMAVVAPHGVLFRGAAEGHIRKYLIEDRNYLDAVIGLPANIFYGTGIPTCILVFKKCRETPDDVLFIDASQHYEKAKNQNYLRDADIEKIVDTFRQRSEEAKYSRRVRLTEITENDHNLNIPRYIDTFEPEDEIDLHFIAENLFRLGELCKENDKIIFKFCEELNLPKPCGKNLHLLRQYKKGVMQKIFSQEIRFSDENGKFYRDWKKQRLSNSLTERNEKAPKSDQYPLMAFVAHIGVTPKGERYNREFLVNDSDGKDYKRTEYGDFIYSSNNLETGSIGLNRFGCASISPVYSIFKIADSCDYEFMSSYLTRKSFINKMIRYRQGVVYGQWRIHESDFLRIVEEIPSFQEQKKIAAFLSAIDEKINLLTRQLEKTD